MDHMEREAAAVLAEAALYLGAAMAMLFVLGGYLAIIIDRGRNGSTTKDEREGTLARSAAEGQRGSIDTQAGLKLVLYALGMAALSLVAVGVMRLLATILGGFHDFAQALRLDIPAIGVGSGVIAGLVFMVLPRTNAATARQVERYALGLVGLQYGLAAIFGVYNAIEGVFVSATWAEISEASAHTIVAGLIAVAAIARFGVASGWSAHVRLTAAPTSTPPPPSMPPMPPMPPPPMPMAPPAQGGGTDGGNPYAPR